MIRITTAEEFRLARIVRGMDIDAILTAGRGITFRVNRNVDVAAWVFDKSTQRVEIWVNPQVLRAPPEGVSDSALEALVAHELMHHLIFNHQHSLRAWSGEGGSRRGLPSIDTERILALCRNLAWDFCIERVLTRAGGTTSEGRAAGTLELSRRFRLSEIPRSGPVPLATQVLLLTASEAPRSALGSVAETFDFLWNQKVPPPPEAAFQVMLPLVSELAANPAGFGWLSAIVEGNNAELGDGVIVRGLPAVESSPDAEREPAAYHGDDYREALCRLLKSDDSSQGWLETDIVPLPISEQRSQALAQWLLKSPMSRQFKKCLEIVAGDLLPSRFQRKPYLLRASRRDLILFAQGYPRVTWNNRTSGESRRIAAYIDTSGSMRGGKQQVVCSLLKALRPILRDSALFAFSSSVAKCTLNQLISGACFGDGGTSLEAVARHAIDHFTHAVVFSDCEAHVSDAVQAALRRSGVRLRAVAFGPVDRESQPWWDWPRVYHWGPIPPSLPSRAW